MSTFWAHQRRAVAVFREYLARRPRSTASLVTMPTGTGKSVVIATLLADATVGAQRGPVLVLAPWRGLAAQLRADIDQRAWTNLDMPRPQSLPDVVGVRSAADFVKRDHGPGSDPAVYVATMAMALEIYKRVGSDPVEMGSLFANFSAVIVDECHYEPAPTWSEAVRATGLPTCLLTATPFRNDNRFFEIDKTACYRYSHAEAVADRILRVPTFERLERARSESSFVHSLLARLSELPVGEDNVIVRCGDRAAVEAITCALRSAGQTAVGFHETFQKADRANGLLQRVPAPEDRPDARFWVHQHKLTEGFDDPKATVLAVYDGFGSDRARVQQVGRVLRNPCRAGDARAWVLSTDAEMEQAWMRYERFDAGEAPRAMATDPAGVEALLSAQPETFYWDRLFRERFDLHDEDAWTHVKFRLSASIRTMSERPDLDALADEVRADHVERDRRVLSIGTPAPDSRVILHLTVENSPVLRTGAFVEMTLGYTVLHWDGGRLFVCDSTSAVPRSVRDRTDPLGATALVGLLREGTRISDISLKNNDLNNWSIRSRSLSAFDLSRIASEIGDTTFGYATAEGHLVVEEDQVSRYTGVRNARVTDRRRSEGTFTELASWFREIGDALDANHTPAQAIDRYATPVTPPATPEAAHVLLDIDPGDFEGADGTSELSIEDYGGEVDSDGNFTIVVDGELVPVHIGWDAAARRFELRSTTSVPFRASAGLRSEFWQEINREQNVRVATNDGLVYTNGNFWSLTNSGRGSSTGLLSLLVDHEPLMKVVAEKGPVDGKGQWGSDTAFGLIDQELLPDALDSTATIVCTDLGREIADFVGFTDSTVIFVHAKSKAATDASLISASALHVVVSQAVKNLKYLTIGNTDTPTTGTLAGTWNGGKHGSTARVRVGPKSRTGKVTWDRINQVIQTHRADRQLWLVLGATLSKSALKRELRKSTPNAVAAQTHALLNSAWAAAQQCGVRLRIYCSP